MIGCGRLTCSDIICPWLTGKIRSRWWYTLKKNINVTPLFSDVTTICLMQCDTFLSHRVDCGLWKVGPLLFNGCVKLLDIGSNWNMLSHTPIQSIILTRVKTLKLSMLTARCLKTCDMCGIVLGNKTAHFRVAFYCDQPKAHLCTNHTIQSASWWIILAKEKYSLTLV